MEIQCEKAITSCDYSTHILLLDMTKALDTINREHIYKLLSQSLDPDVLNIMNILVKDVTLEVQNNKTKGLTFLATLGFSQGDCLSAILFALYLSNGLSPKIPTHLHDHIYNTNDLFLTPTEHLHDHIYCTKQDKNNITDYLIDQQYADHIGFVGKKKNIMKNAMKNIVPILIEKKLDYE